MGGTMDIQHDESISDYEVAVSKQVDFFQTGEEILKIGESSKHACKLISGTAKVMRNGDVVATIKAGEYFGAIAALTGQKRSATVYAADQCVVEKISKHKFRLMLQTEPGLLDKII